MAMAHSGDSVAVDMPIHLIEKEHIITTGHGPVSVIVYGDQEKPPLITYPDIALNHTSCFRGLFFCPESASLLLHNFCIYHITPPGHELGAESISIDDSAPSIEDYSDQILEVLNHFRVRFRGKHQKKEKAEEHPGRSPSGRLGSVMCMGVMAGAYVLTLFALKYSERVTGLILVSPLCRAPTWNEWLYNKFMSNLLYYYGMTDLLKEFLLNRYFSKGVCGSLEVPESDIVRSCRKLLDERDSTNVLQYLQAIHRRPDLTEELKNLECRTIIFVGDSSPFHAEALHMTANLGTKCCALVEVQDCGSVVTEEQPHSMLIPLEYFLKGYGLYRSCWFNNGLRSCLGPHCINPELLSAKSMGVKLRRIKTRVSPPPPRTNQS